MCTKRWTANSANAKNIHFVDNPCMHAPTFSDKGIESIMAPSARQLCTCLTGPLALEGLKLWSGGMLELVPCLS